MTSCVCCGRGLFWKLETGKSVSHPFIGIYQNRLKIYNLSIEILRIFKNKKIINRNKENDETIKYLLDRRRGKG